MVYRKDFLWQWMAVFGGSLYDEASQKVTPNDPKNVEAFTWLKGYWQSMGNIDQLTAMAQMPGFFDAGNPFATKKDAYVTDGFWYYDAIDKNAPDLKYGVTFWPTKNGTDEERKNYTVGGWQYSLPKGIKHPDESWKAMRYMFIDQAAKMGVETLNGCCVVAQMADWVSGLQKVLGSTNRMVPYLSLFTDTSRYATKFFPIIEDQSFYSDEITRVFDLMIRNEKQPQEALDEIAKTVQDDLDKVRASNK